MLNNNCRNLLLRSIFINQQRAILPRLPPTLEDHLGSHGQLLIAGVFSHNHPINSFSTSNNVWTQPNGSKEPQEPKESKEHKAPREMVNVKIAEEKKRAETFILSALLKMANKSANTLEKKFPKATQIYRVFTVGFKDFTKEFVEYVLLKKRVLFDRRNALKRMNLRELGLLYQMKIDLKKVGPVIALSCLPMAQYFVFPLAFMYPKFLLSSHFWSPRQRGDFAFDFQRRRQSAYRPILGFLQTGIDEVENPEDKAILLLTAHKLASGIHPTTEEIIELIPFFSSEPYSLMSIHGKHAKCLCKAHRLSKNVLFRRARLYDHAELLSTMDNRILKKGVEALPFEFLKEACYIRGLNATSISQDEMLIYMNQWIEISLKVTPASYSMLLHLPILIGYNNPYNWAFMRQTNKF